MLLKYNLPPLELPESYEYLLTLPKDKYEWYLKLLFFKRKRYILNLKEPKKFNEKIQWIKLYGTTPLRRDLTDKVLVRNYVEEKIGNKYLKQIYQVKKHFNELDFSYCPDKFLIKCNHGCKWHYFIKDKNAFISNPKILNFVEQKMEKYLSMNFYAMAGFELQYKDIQPLIFTEEFLTTNAENLTEFQIYCFNGKAKLIEECIFSNPAKRYLWDENYKTVNILFNKEQNKIKEAGDEIKKAVLLSEKLSDKFNFVRVDWILCDKGLYFNEMTFTPYSGFLPVSKEDDELLGSYLDLTKGE